MLGLVHWLGLVLHNGIPVIGGLVLFVRIFSCNYPDTFCYLMLYLRRFTFLYGLLYQCTELTYPISLLTIFLGPYPFTFPFPIRIRIRFMSFPLFPYPMSFPLLFSISFALRIINSQLQEDRCSVYPSIFVVVLVLSRHPVLSGFTALKRMIQHHSFLTDLIPQTVGR